MPQTLRILRLLQWTMLLCIVIYSAVGEVVGPHERAVNPTINYLFSTLGVAVVGVIFVVRRTLVLRAAESLASQPDDNLSLGHWRTGYIVTYALCEALALFGLVLRLLGCNFQQCMPFYIGGFVLLFFFRARAPVLASAI